MLDAGELDAIRRDVEDLLPDRAFLYASTPVSDAGGSWEDQWLIYWSGRGRIAPVRSDERAFSEQVLTVADMIATLPYDCPITERHQLLIRGTMYDVQAVAEGSSYDLHTRAAVVARR
jgi:hypothetical protein